MLNRFPLCRSILAIMAILAFVVLPGTASSNQWTADTFVSGVYPNATRLVFRTDFSERDWSSCDGGHRFALDPSNQDYATQVASLLTAFASGKRVRLHAKSGQSLPTCAPLIDRFWILD